MLSMIFTTGSASVIAVEQWNRTFDSGGQALSVQQTEDNGYIFTGYTTRYNPGSGGTWLIKTDIDGNMLWKKTYGGWNPTDEAHSVQQTMDGGYIFTGITYSHGAGDIWLVKTDAAGNEIWNRNFDFGGVDTANSVKQTGEGGYIIVGSNHGSGSEGALLIKTDANGNQQWNKSFEGFANYVQQTSDDGYIIVGGTMREGIGLDVWLVKTNTSGNKQWEKAFKGNDVIARSVVQTKDGGYMIAGWISSFTSSYDAWLIKTDVNGNKEWEKTFGGTGRDFAQSVQQTEDGGYIIAGLTGEEFKGGDTVEAKAWLIKTDIEGNKKWEKTFGGDGDDRFSSVQQTSNGSYIMAGQTTSYSAGANVSFFKGGNAWLVKVSEEPEVVKTKKIPAFESLEALLLFIILLKIKRMRKVA
ncbi:MAG: hypothetical protein OIN86_06740 [Candidatus Methanoperedens sp.]|nr:hypothetical protein [Candidatus Methanoperedens sp.]CAG0956230.1 hypothetical protein METP1_00462 [Methanosarcinales archaeon]